MEQQFGCWGFSFLKCREMTTTNDLENKTPTNLGNSVGLLGKEVKGGRGR